jgi:hypothetical protein
MKRQLIDLVLILLLCSGCSTIRVPQSTYKFNGIDFRLPKDITAKNVEVTVKSGTNTLTFKAAFITSRNDPNVIGATSEGQVDIINAHYKGTSELTDRAIQAAGKVLIPKP